MVIQIYKNLVFPLLHFFVIFIAIANVACYKSSLKGDSDGNDDQEEDVSSESEHDWHDIDVDVWSDDGSDISNDHLDIADWFDFDFPEIDDETPVVEPVGPPIQLDDETHAGGDPVVAWNGSGWGVAWADMMNPVIFRPLNELADPIGPAVAIDPYFNCRSVALEWKFNRYAIAGSTHANRIGTGIIDEHGNLIHGINWITGNVEEPDLAWSSYSGDYFIVYTTTVEAEIESYFYGALIDDSATLIDDPILIGWGGIDSHGPRAIALKSRLALAWLNEEGIWHRSFSWPNVHDAPPQRLILPMRVHPDSYIEATGFRDLSMVVGMDGTDVQVVVAEAWSGDVISGPVVVGHSRIIDRRPGIAAVIDRGYLGICYEIGPPPDGVSDDNYGIIFRLITPDGYPFGAEITIASDLDNVGDCAVGWSGSEFIVIYWSCGGDSRFNIMLAQRVRPLI